MLRLHRLLHRHEQMLTQRAEIGVSAQLRAKLRQRSGRVVLVAVETAVDETLHDALSGLDEHHQRQRRDDKDHRLLF
jgi:hypothetical protein